MVHFHSHSLLTQPMCSPHQLVHLGAASHILEGCIALQDSRACAFLTALAPQGRAQEVACDYLVAADGARSALRRALGVPLGGQPALQVASCLACPPFMRDAYPLAGSGQTLFASVRSSSLQ